MDCELSSSCSRHGWLQMGSAVDTLLFLPYLYFSPAEPGIGCYITWVRFRHIVWLFVFSSTDSKLIKVMCMSRHHEVGFSFIMFGSKRFQRKEHVPALIPWSNLKGVKAIKRNQPSELQKAINSNPLKWIKIEYNNCWSVGGVMWNRAWPSVAFRGRQRENNNTTTSAHGKY